MVQCAPKEVKKLPKSHKGAYSPGVERKHICETVDQRKVQDIMANSEEKRTGEQ